jgi:hypothetical protein
MAKAELYDVSGNTAAQVLNINANGRQAQGLVVFPEDAHTKDAEFRPFLNATYGTALNQNVTFGGTPEIIHNGATSTEWTAAAAQGTWDFTTGAVITMAAANNNDHATFSEETPTTIEADSFVALTGSITLTTYSAATRDIELYFDLAGVENGTRVSLNDYIDTSLLGSAQTFAITIGSFGLSDNTIDGFNINNLKTGGGAKASYTMDDIQLEETGSPIEYKVTPEGTTEYFVQALRFQLADNVTGAAALSYNKFLGVSQLANGITFTKVIGGVTQFSAQLKDVSDLFYVGGETIHSPFDDGTNTMLDIGVKFDEPFLLEGNPDLNYLSLTINDPLNGLLLFRCGARGYVRKHTHTS